MDFVPAKLAGTPRKYLRNLAHFAVAVIARSGRAKRAGRRSNLLHSGYTAGDCFGLLPTSLRASLAMTANGNDG